MSDVVIDFAKVLDFYNPNNRTSSFDKIIHSNLIKFFGRDCQVATEIFELSKEYKNPKDIFIDAVEKTASNEWKKFDPSRPYNYNPRKGSQDEVIKAIKAAVKNNCRKFLLGCKCRFGKTFTSYEIAKELGYSNIIIMTFRPGDTKEAWKSDEFMNAFIDVISSSKKNFGIAIERFKMMPFKFAMEDVPEMLAEKMLDKFSKKRDLIDAACKDPTLLKMA